jgi:hypothetical protein
VWKELYLRNYAGQMQQTGHQLVFIAVKSIVRKSTYSYII